MKIQSSGQSKNTVTHAGPSLDHYVVLSIARDAPPEVVRAAWRALCKTHHPDRNPGHAATGRVAEINCAYEILSNPATRAEYDLWLKGNEGPDGLPQPPPAPWWRTRHGMARLAAAVLLFCAALAATGTFRESNRGKAAESAWMRAAVDASRGGAAPRSLPADPDTVLRLSASVSLPHGNLQLASGSTATITVSRDSK